MKKKLEDYLHFYYGQKTTVGKVDGHLLDMKFISPHIKLILRPLSSMTEEESIELDETFGDLFEDVEDAAKQTAWLLSKHFDLFGLIKSGLAIDATTVEP